MLLTLWHELWWYSKVVETGSIRKTKLVQPQKILRTGLPNQVNDTSGMSELVMPVYCVLNIKQLKVAFPTLFF